MTLKSDSDFATEIDALTAQVRDLKSQLAAQNPTKPTGTIPSADGNSGSTLLARYAAISSPREMAVFMRDNAAAITELLKTGSTTAEVAPQVSMAELEAQYAALTSDSDRREFFNKNATAIARAA